MTLHDRVRTLIESRYGGNVNAAAKASGIPQRNLAAIVAREIKNPRAELVGRIARWFMVSTDWLLTGEGKGPDDEWGVGVQEFLEWKHLITDLKLDEPVHTLTLRLPRAAAGAMIVFRVSQLGGRPTRKRKIEHYELEERAPFAPGFLDASRLEYQAWLAFFKQWLELAGREKVRQVLMRNAEAIRVRFADAE